jgi:hypothetical protein
MIFEKIKTFYMHRTLKKSVTYHCSQQGILNSQSRMFSTKSCGCMLGEVQMEHEVKPTDHAKQIAYASLEKIYDHHIS